MTAFGSFGMTTTQLFKEHDTHPTAKSWSCALAHHEKSPLVVESIVGSLVNLVAQNLLSSGSVLKITSLITPCLWLTTFSRFPCPVNERAKIC